jgi:hypothetical protein
VSEAEAFLEGVKKERDCIVEWLRETAKELAAVAQAIEDKEHWK